MNFISVNSGTSVEGDEIQCFRSEQSANKYIYLMAGIHGDEVEGIYVLQKLFEWLKERDVSVDLPLLVLPIVNVDGHRSGTRVNSHGVDLNRNLPSSSWSPEFKQKKFNPGPSALSEPENVYLVELFEKYPPAFILTFHTWKPMINYNGSCLSEAEILNKHNNYPLYPDIDNYPTPGCLGDYGPEVFDTPVITFECPPISDELTLKNIWEENEEALKVLLQSEVLKKRVLQ